MTTTGVGPTTTGVGPSATSTGSGQQPELEKTELDERVLDYSEALRTASLLIVGNAPTLTQIYELGDVPLDQQKAKYEALVDALLADARFADTLVDFFKYTFKMGGPSTTPGEPTRDTAPALAARTVFEEKPWTNILTQSSNNCPTFNPVTHTFADGMCANQASLTAAGVTASGILTDPGAHSLFFGNLSFRRNRFFHESFLCRSGNEQAGGEPTDMPPMDPPCAGSTDPGLPKQVGGQRNRWQVQRRTRGLPRLHRRDRVLELPLDVEPSFTALQPV